MNVTIHQMEKMLRGQYVFKQFAFSMLMTRLKRDYADTPTRVNLERCVHETNTFLNKYRIIMHADFAMIKTL
ncbi:MAG: hypothetical protein FWC64_05960 [Treponema sp.]|nr:hypothetical protein [Treponema sp.]